MNQSIWEENQEKMQKQISPLHSDIKTDILIIGGGIAGITTAYFLRKSKKDIVLIDKGAIAMGVTAKTTAKINYLQGIIYQTLEKSFNRNISRKYYDSQIKAISLLRDIIKKEQIDCDLEQCSSVIFTTQKSGVSKIKKEAELLKSFNVSCSEVIKDNVYGIKVDDTYTFHPLQYLKKLSEIIKKEIKIYEYIIAMDIIKKQDKYIVTTNKNRIIASSIVVACHYPFFLIPNIIPLRTYIKREYVNAGLTKAKEKYTAISIDKRLHSIRFYKNYIIYGSNQHRLTDKINYKALYQKSREDFEMYFKVKPQFSWLNQDVMSNDYLPIIGRCTKNDSTLLIATAFGSWGMTNGTIAGKIISDILLNKKNEFEDLFSPTRINSTSILESFLGSFHYAKIYITTTINKNPSFYDKNVYVTKINGKSCGVYIDDEKKTHIISIKCPHMKCNLVFNPIDLSWDCPCHGSRFDIDGNIIEGPANSRN